MQHSLTNKRDPLARHISAHARPKPHRLKLYRLRCDCGQLAVTEIKVRVGTDQQYIVKLPLCAACLALELSYNAR